MGELARIVRHGEGQSVELPEGFRFGGAQVKISREGDRVVLEPAVDQPYDPEAIDPETGLTVRELRTLIAAAEDEGGDAEWNVDEVLGHVRAASPATRGV